MRCLSVMKKFLCPNVLVENMTLDVALKTLPILTQFFLYTFSIRTLLSTPFPSHLFPFISFRNKPYIYHKKVYQYWKRAVHMISRRVICLLQFLQNPAFVIHFSHSLPAPFLTYICPSSDITVWHPKAFKLKTTNTYRGGATCISSAYAASTGLTQLKM